MDPSVAGGNPASGTSPGPRDCQSLKGATSSLYLATYVVIYPIPLSSRWQAAASLSLRSAGASRPGFLFATCLYVAQAVHPLRLLRIPRFLFALAPDEHDCSYW